MKYVIFSLVLFAGMSIVSFGSDTDPCLTKCSDVRVGTNDSVVANILLTKAQVEIELTSSYIDDQENAIAVPNVEGQDVYLESSRSSQKYYCSQATDSLGKCTISNVPTEIDYMIKVNSWFSGIPLYYNLPYAEPTDILQQNEYRKIILFDVNLCDRPTPPPSYCDGSIVMKPFPECENSFWEFFPDPDGNCQKEKRSVCQNDGRATVVDGICEDSSAGAACQEGSCNQAKICSFSSPAPVDKPFFYPGDIVVLEGSNFEDEGGEVRIGDTRIFIDNNDSRPDFYWTDEKISFVLPYGTQTGTIGVRPLGYDYVKAIDPGTKEWYFVKRTDPNTDLSYKIPIYCLGGVIQIADVSGLQIDGSSDVNVSVSGG